MGQLLVTGLEDLGDDRLRVTASDGDAEYEAFGWVSATTDHYDDSQYADYTADDVAKPDVPIGSTGRHLKPDQTPRTMTDAERGEYALALILDQHPQLTPQSAASLTFTAPAPVYIADPVVVEPQPTSE